MPPVILAGNPNMKSIIHDAYQACPLSTTIKRYQIWLSNIDYYPPSLVNTNHSCPVSTIIIVIIDLINHTWTIIIQILATMKPLTSHILSNITLIVSPVADPLGAPGGTCLGKALHSRRRRRKDRSQLQHHHHQRSHRSLGGMGTRSGGSIIINEPYGMIVVNDRE